MRPPDLASLGVPSGLVERILDLPRGNRRRLIGIAGAPASGKSTLAEALVFALGDAGATVENVPMDGFHLDNRILERRGLLERKGAPETFDARGFLAMIARLLNDEDVVYPIFDRDSDLAIAGAGVVGPECDLIVVEGNYLLFNEAPWSELQALWDLSIWVDVSEAVVLERCIRRWVDNGSSPEAARLRAEGNDLRNARRIMSGRLTADLVIPVTRA